MRRIFRGFFRFSPAFGLLASVFVSDLAFAVKDPNFRWKMGYFLTDTNAGAVIKETPRNSLLTVQPTLLWDVPTIRTKVGVHFMAEFLSDFGLMPLSGAGVSAYFFPFGISSTTETNHEGVLFQKSLTSPYLLLAATTSPWVALPVFFVFGAHAFVWGTTSTTVRQRAVPAGLQGRVSAVNTICVYGGLVIGAAAGGLLAREYGTAGPFWAAFAASAVFLALLWPVMTRIAHRDEL